MSDFALTLNTANISKTTARKAVPSIFGLATAVAKKYSSSGCVGKDEKTKKKSRDRLCSTPVSENANVCLHSTSN